MTNVRLMILLPTLALAAGANAGGAAFDSPSADRLEALRAEIQHHDQLYFRDTSPEISDAAYDRLKCELTELEKKFFPIGEVGDSRAPIGDDRAGAHPTARHGAPMLSLDKSYSEAELRTFYARLCKITGCGDVACTVEPKFDGLAISVVYEKGKLIRAVTRGNGFEGDDVTANVLAISSLPHELRLTAANGATNPIPETVELRGEIYLPLAEFARLNDERESAGEDLFAHPRNVAAATLKQRDPRLVSERRLAAVFYGWGACEPAIALPTSQHDFHRRVRDWGLPCVETFETIHGADEMWAAVESFERGRRDFPAPTDGLVIKLDSIEGRSAVGTSAHAPKWAMAYKFAPDQTETQLKGITLQVGRTGVLTPVAEFAPVKLGGSLVSRARLHSVGEISRRDIRIGDTLYLERSGDVIPTVAGVNLSRRSADSHRYEFPKACPYCGNSITQDAGAGVIRCPNRSCPAQVRRRVEHFASESCMHIAGLGPESIDSLVSHASLKNIPDLYRLRRDDLVGHVPSFSTEKSCDRLLAAISRSKGAALWRLIYGLGIPQVGAVAAREVERQFQSLESVLKAFAPSETGEVVVDEEGFGLRPSVVRSLVAYFSDPGNRKLVGDLVALGVSASPASSSEKRKFATEPVLAPATHEQLGESKVTIKLRRDGKELEGQVSGTDASSSRVNSGIRYFGMEEGAEAAFGGSTVAIDRQ